MTSFDFFSALESNWCVASMGRRTRINVNGSDRATFLQNFCTNDVKSVAPGEGVEAFFTNAQGKAVGHAFLFATCDAMIIDTSASQAEPLIAHLDRYVIMESVEFEDVSETTAHLLVAGPQLNAKAAEFGWQIHESPLSHGAAELDGITIHLHRLDWTGQPSLMITCAEDAKSDIRASLTSRGAIGGSDAELEVARIQAGVPVYGKDITDANLPQEIDRNEQTLHFNKGCYLGQETVARLDAMGHVNWLLRRVIILDPSVIKDSEIEVNGSVVARVRSTAVLDGRTIGLAYIRAQHASPGKIDDSIEVVG